MPRKTPKIPGLMHHKQLAELLGVTPRTLQQWRRDGRGPPFVRIASQIYYRDRDRDAWLSGSRVKPPHKENHAWVEGCKARYQRVSAA